MAQKLKAGVNTQLDKWNHVFSHETRRALHELVDFDESNIPDDSADTGKIIKGLSGAEVVFSTWGAHTYTQEVLDACPDLKLILYGAGSVKGMANTALIKRGVTVCSAVHLNARPVAEFVLGIILTSLRNVFAHYHAFKTHGASVWGQNRKAFAGSYYKTIIGLLGYGRVSQALIELLAPFDFQVYLNDPYLSPEETKQLGVSHGTAEWIMENCDVVSLHHGNKPENENMIHRDNLALLKPGARFINTSRGQLVNEDDLVARLQKGDISAYLDVTNPEPPEPGHSFYKLPNCILTPHIAGSMGNEAQRMGDYCLRELEHWLAGEELENAVDLRMELLRA